MKQNGISFRWKNQIPWMEIYRSALDCSSFHGRSLTFANKMLIYSISMLGEHRGSRKFRCVSRPCNHNLSWSWPRIISIGQQVLCNQQRSVNTMHVIRRRAAVWCWSGMDGLARGRMMVWRMVATITSCDLGKKNSYLWTFGFGFASRNIESGTISLSHFSKISLSTVTQGSFSWTG